MREDFRQRQAKPEDTGLDKPAITTFETFDKFTYVLKIGKPAGENQPVALSVSAVLAKEREAAKDAASAIAINALFPHLLAGLCRERGARLLHFSTDCVFSGRCGPYSESDPSDAEDLYGRTKFLGEVGGVGCLTIRSSIIGREIAGRTGLLEWRRCPVGLRIAEIAGQLRHDLAHRREGYIHCAGAELVCSKRLRLTHPC